MIASKQPLKPFDIKFTLGEWSNFKELINVKINLEMKPEGVDRIYKGTQIKEPLGQDCVFKFQFMTQEGRQKECLEYFQNGLDRSDHDEYDTNLSPLQNFFKRPKKAGKLELNEQKGKVILQYRFYKEIIEDDNEIGKIKDRYTSSKFHSTVDFTLNMRGNIVNNKKNRTSLKVDFLEAHIMSDQFRTAHFMDLMDSFKAFGHDEEAEFIKNNPIFKLIEGSQEIKLHLKFASPRKILDLYHIGLRSSGNQEQKEAPEVIKGLFKDHLKITLAYSDKIGAVLDCKYQNQSVLIRLLSAWKNFMQKL